MVTGLFHSVDSGLGHQTSHNESFCDDYIAETVEICGDYLTHGSRTQMFYSAYKSSFRINNVSTSTDNLPFEDTEDNEQKQRKSVLDQKNNLW